MKKVLFAMAIASMFGFVACNNNKPVEAEPIEAVAEEQVADTNAVEAMVEEVVDAAVEAVAE